LDGLGDRFIGFIEKAFNLIELSTERFLLRTKSFREFVVGKFPYVIVYEYIKRGAKDYNIACFSYKTKSKTQVQMIVKLKFQMFYHH
jgi:hypothetical protein